MGNQKYGDWSNFAKFFPFNQSEHYHSYCLITDFTDQHQVNTIKYYSYISIKCHCNSFKSIYGKS